MNDKKNIDRLFQERFKDFESVPNDKVWNHIHDALHDQKKRKIIPLWWKFSGIAAGFILVFLAFNSVWTSGSNDPSVVVTPKEIENTDSDPINQNSASEIQVAVENKNSSVNENTMRSNKTELNLQSKNKNTTLKTISTPRDKAIATHTKKTEKQNLNHKTIVSDTPIVLNVPNEKSNNVPVYRNEKKSESEVVTVFNETDTERVLPKKSTLTETKKDSTALALVPEPNPLEELLKNKNKKEEIVAVAKKERWQVSTNVAPVYFNSISNGSPIEAQFEENSKSYENNLSVGVGIQYAVNKKLSIRSGVNKVTLGYATNDVVFFGALNSVGFSNLESSNSNPQMEVVSANNTNALRPFEDNMQNSQNGVLNQRMGYYEVPLEVSYALVNRKFGIHVIGGLSTLFLNENSVSVQSQTTSLSLGKANNLSPIHFSSNVGLGFKYEFIKNFEAHFEPTFKYQFNTFSRDAGNFKPYFIGLYTGVSFKF